MDRARMPRSLRVRPLGHRVRPIGYRDTPRASTAALSLLLSSAHTVASSAQSQSWRSALSQDQLRKRWATSARRCWPAGVAASRKQRCGGDGMGTRRGVYDVYWKQQHAHVLRQECAHVPKWVVHDQIVSLASCVLFCASILSPLRLLVRSLWRLAVPGFVATVQSLEQKMSKATAPLT
jgi:hypothetical protein